MNKFKTILKVGLYALTMINGGFMLFETIKGIHPVNNQTCEAGEDTTQDSTTSETEA